MDATEKPKAWLPGKPRKRNPAYDAWRKAQKEAPVIALVPVIEYVGTESEITVEIGEPEILTLRCVKLARNTTFVYCAKDDGIVGVKVKRGIGPKLLKKAIKVRKEGETYFHVP